MDDKGDLLLEVRMQLSVFELDKRLAKMAEPLGLFGVSAHDSPSSPFSLMTSPPSVSLFMRIAFIC